MAATRVSKFDVSDFYELVFAVLVGSERHFSCSRECLGFLGALGAYSEC